MYRKLRSLHRWAGLVSSLFLILIASTGFLLANKPRWDWVQPPTLSGGEVAGLAEVVSVEQAAQAAFDLDLPELQSREDIDRIDYRPDKNVFKIVSKRGYREVQVDGKTGEALSNQYRTDQLTEDIHDLSFFADFAHAWVLPAVGLFLFFLGVSGVLMFFTPAVRRWRYRRSLRKV